MKNDQQQITITATMSAAHEVILNDDATRFLARLANKFEDRRQQCLDRRRERQKSTDEGHLPEFIADTAHVRESNWTATTIRSTLLDRRVEITGPVDRKMIIN